MKLLEKSNRYYLLFTPISLLLGSILMYAFINYVFYDEIEERLVYQKQIVQEEIAAGRIPGSGKLLEVREVAPGVSIPETFSDTSFYEPIEKEEIPYRQLDFSSVINGQNYHITIRNSPGELEPLVASTALAMALILVFILLMVNYMTGLINQKVWSPFNSTLDQIRSYDVTSGKTLSFESGDIDEFNELNQAIHSMSERINKDYTSLKEFAENAAHEMQTPLAIIRSKLELLMQSGDLGEEQVKLLTSVSEASGRLARLNQSLLLLTKIENRQFQENEQVDLYRLVKRLLEDLEEFIAFRQLSTELNREGAAVLQMNPMLAEILISNLLQNAIRYSSTPAIIKITINEQSLAVSNTGDALSVDSDKLFQRFQKGSSNSQSVGLGLAIVKEICDTYQFECSYSYSDRRHTFRVHFS